MINPITYVAKNLKEVYRTGMIIVVVILLFADQNLTSTAFSQIGFDVGLTAGQLNTYMGGLLPVGFFLVGAPASFWIGWKGDSWNRRNLLVGSVIFGEIACALIYFVEDYWMLFVLRALTGVAIGGAIPLLMGIFGDIYGENYRGLVSGIVGVAMSNGGTVGQAIMAAYLQDNNNDWRTPFLVVSLPAIAGALLLYFTTEDPQRGLAETIIREKIGKVEDGEPHATYAEEFSWGKVRTAFRHKTVWFAMMQGIPGSIPWGIIFVYMISFFSDDRGIPALEVAGLSAVLGATVSVGSICGGWAGDQLGKINRRYTCYMMGLTTCIGTFLFIIVFNLEQLTVGGYTGVIAAAGIIVSFTGANVKAFLTNVTVPEVRGSVFGVFNTMDDVGRGGGAFVVSMIIAAFDDRRVPAFNISLLGWVLCGFIVFCIAFVIDRDTKDFRDMLKQAEIKDGDAIVADLESYSSDGKDEDRVTAAHPEFVREFRTASL